MVKRWLLSHCQWQPMRCVRDTLLFHPAKTCNLRDTCLMNWLSVNCPCLDRQAKASLDLRYCVGTVGDVPVIMFCVGNSKHHNHLATLVGKFCPAVCKGQSLVPGTNRPKRREGSVRATLCNDHRSR